MMKKLLLVVLVFAGLVSCKKTATPADENEHESVNKIEFTFNTTGSAASVFVMEDPDGDGGNPPSRIDTIKLNAGATYTLDVKTYNIVNGVQKDITSVITSQSSSHELFFIPTGVTLTITKNDKDRNNYPVGLNSTWVVGSAATGSLRFKVMHKPAGLKGPNDAPTVGHSDIDLNIPIKLQ
jgi:hypothetical protein